MSEITRSTLTPRSAKEDTARGWTPTAVCAVSSSWISAYAANGPNYHSVAWATFNTTQQITVKHTKAYRPQTNGKVERYQRTMRDEWGYGRAYASETSRRKALLRWLHHYNHHRAHTALGGKPPITRVTNVPGQST